MSDEEPAELVELDLDKLSRDILAALDAVGGESNSQLLRRELEDVGSTPFNYRLTTYLEPLGLVETHQPEATPGNIPPKEITLTEKGREYINTVVVGSGGNDVEDRLEHLEDRVETLQQENQELREKNRELQAAVEQAGTTDIQGELRQLNNRIDSLQDRILEVENEPIVASNIAPALLNATAIRGNVCTNLLKEELGKERVGDEQEKVQSSMEQEDELVTAGE